jgi:hypothetical protein
MGQQTTAEPSKPLFPQYKNIPVNDDVLIVELIEALENIDEATSLAKLNEISIADNNGGRIYF